MSVDHFERFFHLIELPLTHFLEEFEIKFGKEELGITRDDADWIIDFMGRVPPTLCGGTRKPFPG